MKKIIAILPHGYEWFSAVEHALAFGLSAALALRVIPVLYRAVGTGATRTRAAMSLRRTLPSPYLKVFGQRR